MLHFYLSSRGKRVEAYRVEEGDYLGRNIGTVMFKLDGSRGSKVFAALRDRLSVAENRRMVKWQGERVTGKRRKYEKECNCERLRWVKDNMWDFGANIWDEVKRVKRVG